MALWVLVVTLAASIVLALVLIVIVNRISYWVSHILASCFLTCASSNNNNETDGDGRTSDDTCAGRTVHCVLYVVFTAAGVACYFAAVASYCVAYGALWVLGAFAECVPALEPVVRALEFEYHAPVRACDVM
jgi:hypothetical protein